MSTRKPAQKPVPIPDHLRHGSSYVHRHYGCRCGKCQRWRREYDQKRDQAARKGPYKPELYQRITRAPWYTCVEGGVRYRNHRYSWGQCVRCGAKQATEELWERKWNET